MLMVSGASGHLGRRTVELLLEHTDAARVVALTRTPERLADLAARGVTVRAADFDDETGLVAAFDGAERLLLISTDRLGPGGERIHQHTAAVRAAAKAGVGHLLYTSFTRADEADNPVVVAPDHRATERVLAESGVPFTALRSNLYTESLLASAGPALATGVLASNAGDGRAGYVTREDCAAAAAGMLATGGHEGALLEITGPASIGYAEVAAALTEVTGTPVRYQAQTDAETVAGMVAAGLPEGMAQMIAGFGSGVRDGWLDVVTTVVTELSGRPPTGVAEFLAAHQQELTTG